MGNSNYTRGDMAIDGHEGTYSGFMGASMYGGAAIIMILLFPVLWFAVGFGWFTSLFATVVVGVIIGAALKFKAQWFAGLIGVSVLLAVAIVIGSLFA